MLPDHRHLAARLRDATLCSRGIEPPSVAIPADDPGIVVDVFIVWSHARKFLTPQEPA